MFFSGFRRVKEKSATALNHLLNFVQNQRMKVYNNILETIGNTPLVRINKLTAEVSAQVFAKVETTNPGNSVKDRMAVKMIEDAEKA